MRWETYQWPFDRHHSLGLTHSWAVTYVTQTWDFPAKSHSPYKFWLSLARRNPSHQTPPRAAPFGPWPAPAPGATPPPRRGRSRCSRRFRSPLSTSTRPCSSSPQSTRWSSNRGDRAARPRRCRRLRSWYMSIVDGLRALGRVGRGRSACALTACARTSRGTRHSEMGRWATRRWAVRALRAAPVWCGHVATFPQGPKSARHLVPIVGQRGSFVPAARGRQRSARRERGKITTGVNVGGADMVYQARLFLCVHGAHAVAAERLITHKPSTRWTTASVGLRHLSARRRQRQRGRARGQAA